MPMISAPTTRRARSPPTSAANDSPRPSSAARPAAASPSGSSGAAAPQDGGGSGIRAARCSRKRYSAAWTLAAERGPARERSETAPHASGTPVSAAAVDEHDGAIPAACAPRASAATSSPTCSASRRRHARRAARAPASKISGSGFATPLLGRRQHRVEQRAPSPVSRRTPCSETSQLLTTTSAQPARAQRAQRRPAPRRTARNRRPSSSAARTSATGSSRRRRGQRRPEHRGAAVAQLGQRGSSPASS